jgi:hypothetical protein
MSVARPDIEAALHAVVRLSRPLAPFMAGTEGTIVAAHPELDSYLLEVEDARGIDTVEARREDFDVIRRS